MGSPAIASDSTVRHSFDRWNGCNHCYTSISGAHVLKSRNVRLWCRAKDIQKYAFNPESDL